MSTVPVTTSFKDYRIKCNTHWYKKKDGTAIPVKMFQYTLSQYTPSVYALVTIIIPYDALTEFRTIEQLEIKDRTIEVYFQDELYSLNNQKSYYAGPFKFCVVDYNVDALPLTQVDLEGDTGDAKIITMHCIDRIFYEMTLNETFGSFGKIKISDVVRKIVTKRGGMCKCVVDTDYAFNWLQCQMNDYQFIRSMLPYAKASNGNLCYTFFMFNNSAYFAPISYASKYPVSLSVDNIRNVNNYIGNQSLNNVIEKFGNVDGLYCASHGHESFDSVKPDKMGKVSKSQNSGNSGIHKSSGTKYLYSAIEDETLQKNYVSNYRQRIYSFSKVLSISCVAIPDILPINCIQIINNSTDGKVRPYSGTYYAVSVTYKYSETPTRPDRPTMDLVLSSEVDINNTQGDSEGSPVS